MKHPHDLVVPLQVTSTGLAHLLEISPDALIVVDHAGTMVMVNTQVERLFGYAQRELSGQPLDMLLPDRFRSTHAICRVDYFSAPRARQIGTGLQLLGKLRDGTEFPVDVSLRPLLLDGVMYAAGSIRDMTEQKRLEDELVVRNHELEQMNHQTRRQRDELVILNTVLKDTDHARSQFLSTMSHELRTPLASIIGFSQLLLDDEATADLGQMQKSNLERILKNGQHLLGLVNEVLDIEKMDAGRLNVTFTRLDVGDLITSVVDELQSIAIRRNLVLSAEIEEGVDYLESDAVKLRQILLNLVANALKFTEQGSVTVTARRLRSFDENGDTLAIVVRDTGIGIAPEMQESIFEPFYQVDSSYTRKTTGTGLGLAIVSRLTALLAGKIEVASVSGQGSAFTLTFPITVMTHSRKLEIPRLHLAQHEQDAMGLRTSRGLELEESGKLVAGSALQDEQHSLILVVDDNPEVMVLIKDACKGTPFTVVGVQDPRQVMEMVQAMHPSAITLDVMMPDVNGWQILHQLKSDPTTASIPVVMLTVLAEPVAAYVLGADEFLTKPFDKQALLTTLHRLIVTK